MFWTFVAVICAGIAGAGIGLILNRATGRRLPGWVTPVLAGAAMLATTIGQEYAWYGQALGTMAPDTSVVAERRQRAVWQPWTYVAPYVKGFIAIQPAETMETAAGSGIFVAQTHIRERWQPGIIRPVLVDCTAGRRADLTPEVAFTDDGGAEGADWLEVDTSDPIVAAVCGGAAG